MAYNIHFTILLSIMGPCTSFVSNTYYIALLQASDTDITNQTSKTLTKNNVGLCATECAHNPSCNSFSFKVQECNLHRGKLRVGDPRLKTSKGYSYYHVLEKPEPTDVKLFEDEVTYAKAAIECQKLNLGRLVTIHDNFTQAVVEDLMKKSVKKSTAWIGLNGTVSESEEGKKKYYLRWADGYVYHYSTSYNYFAPTNPNGKGHQCVGAIHQWDDIFAAWVDDDCGLKRKYICQFSKE